MTSVEELKKVFERLEIEVCVSEDRSQKVSTMMFQPELIEKIRRCQEYMLMNERESLSGEELQTRKDDKGILRFASRIWIPV